MNWKILLNPFEKHSEKALLTFGITLTILGSFIGYLMNARFDGIFDMHLVENISLFEPLVDNLLNTLTLFIVFFAFGKTINPKTRAVDLLTVSLISRIPIYLISLANIGGVIDRATQNILTGIDFDNLQNPPQFEMQDMTVMLVFTLFSIALLIWMIALLWNGFRVATNTKGTRNIVIFAFLFILAYVVSKILISILNF